MFRELTPLLPLIALFFLVAPVGQCAIAYVLLPWWERTQPSPAARIARTARYACLALAVRHARFA